MLLVILAVIKNQGGVTVPGTNRLVTGLVAGAAAGAAAALLFAPKPGKVTRRFVAMRTGKMRRKTSNYVVGLRRRIRRGGDEPLIQAVGAIS